MSGEDGLDLVRQLGEVLLGDLDDGQELLAVATSEPFAGRAMAQGPGITKARRRAAVKVLARLLGSNGRRVA